MTPAPHPDLVEARDSLAYWERRARELPRRDRRGRREAVQRAAKARAHVTRLERESYGKGVAGTVSQVTAEGRLPEPLRDTGRRVARRGRHAVVAVVALTAATALLVLAIAVAILVSVL